MIFSRCTSRVALRASRSVPRRKFWSSRFAQDGTIEFVLGGTLLAIVAVDQLLQYQQNQGREEFLNQLRNERTRSPEDLQEMEDWYNMPAIFDCVVRKMPLNLDGYKCLTGVDVGDVVQVLQEKVGPEDMYNICRKVDDKGRPISAGWFPTMYLEKK